MECQNAGTKSRLISVKTGERFFLCVNHVGILEVRLWRWVDVTFGGRIVCLQS
jgi:hypothetical protein